MENLPTASPDGKWLAYFSMKRPTYEADRQVLMLRDLATGQVRALTEAWDRSVASIAWGANGKTIYVTADDTQETPAFSVDVASGKVTRLTQEGHVSSLNVTPKGLVLAMNSLTAPDDFYLLAGKKTTRLTSVNASKLAGIDMPTVTRFSFAGANNDTVWGYAGEAGRPRRRREGARRIHGPWRPAGIEQQQLVLSLEPRGVRRRRLWPGCGRFPRVDRLRPGLQRRDPRQLGRLAARGSAKGLAAATTKFTWLDGDNACALGASYGGYMMNWFEGKWPDSVQMHRPA